MIDKIVMLEEYKFIALSRRIQEYVEFENKKG